MLVSLRLVCSFPIRYTHDQIREWQTDVCLRPTTATNILIELLTRRQLVNLTGGSGQGKSRLLEDIKNIAENQGIRVALLNIEEHKQKYEGFLQSVVLQLGLNSAIQYANLGEVINYLNQRKQYFFLLMIDNLEVLNDSSDKDPRYDAKFVESLNLLKNLNNIRLLCVSQEWLKKIVFNGKTPTLTLHHVEISPLTTDNIQNELKRRLPPKHPFLTKTRKQKLLCNAVQENTKPCTLLEQLIRRLTSHPQEKFEDILNNCLLTLPKALPQPIQQLIKNMVLVEGGTFKMDSRVIFLMGNDERTVTLDTYHIAKYQVTQAQWVAVMGNNPSYFKGDNLPVEEVSWDDIEQFLQKLNQLTAPHYIFSLPTEAQWEYAARGGKHSKGYVYAGSNNLDEVAWYYDNSGTQTHPVGQKKPNELGLYDMSGNVWEWCQDWYDDYPQSRANNPTGPTSGSSRVVRGGSWSNGPQNCRVSVRGGINPSDRAYYVGFRVSRRS